MKNEKMKEILDFFRNNKKKTCIGAGAGVAVIAVCVAVGITLGNGAKTTASNTGTQTQTETTTETAETETTLQMPLEENTVPEVTQLITEYYNAAAAGDMDTINSIGDADLSAEDERAYRSVPERGLLYKDRPGRRFLFGLCLL